MRAWIFSLLLVIALQPLLPAAEPQPWKPVQMPAETVGTPRSICFTDAKSGWIVGDRGMCLATVDGGVTWEPRVTGSDATLRCVRFTDGKSGFACGDGDSHAPDAKGHVVMGRPFKSGSVLATADGGKTWKALWVPCNFEVWCVEGSTAPNLQVGVGCEEHLDGDITRSADAGATWTERRVFRALSDIRAVKGKRWVAVGSPVSVGFSGEIKDPAYLAKKCRALYSNDAGQTWSVSKGSDGDTVLRALLCREGLLLAVGDKGTILRSEDEGATWQAVASPAAVNLKSVASSADGSAIVAVGDRGAVLVSADAGKTWKATWSGQPSALLSVAWCGGAFFAVGPNGIVRCPAAELAKPGLPALPEEAKPAVAVATAAQRARVRKGDYVVYRTKISAPAMGMNAEFEARSTVTDVNGDEYTLKTEVIKGEPPMGMPKSTEEKGGMAFLDDPGTLPVDKEEVSQGNNNQTFTTTRLANETLTVGKQKLECVVIRNKITMGTAGEADGKSWYCVKDLPLAGLVKLEGTQSMALPNGTKASVTQSQELIEYGRGK